MSPKQAMPVNPSVLIWAREEAGLRQEDAAVILRIDVNELDQIENGMKAAGVGLLRKMAAKYSVPFANLFMPQPLPHTRKPKDLRTVAGARPPFGTDTVQAIRRVTDWHERVGELVVEAPDLYDMPRLEKGSVSGSPIELARAERARLNTSIDEQISWRNADEAFRHWRWRLERLGILVFLVKMPVSECRGFSLWTEGETLPSLAVNRAELSQARIFTLFHEYAHLLIRESALCLEFHQGVVERFCNRFAAEFLMPSEGLERVMDLGVLNTVPSRDWPLSPLNSWATKLKVSRPALALRLEELHLAPPGYYARISKAVDGQAAKKKRDQSGAPPPSVAVLAEKGTQYTFTVLSAMHHGVIDSIEAGDLLGTSRSHLAAIESKLEDRGRRFSGGL